MKAHQVSEFWKGTYLTPWEDLGRAILLGRFPNRPFDKKERGLARRRIQDIDEIHLSEAMEAIAEIEANCDRFLESQAPRHREEKYLPPSLQDQLKRARSRQKPLEEEKQKLQQMVKESLLVEATQKQEEGERKAADFTVKARKFIEEIQEKPESVDQVIALAEALGGKNLEDSFMNFLKARFVYEDLQVAKRHLEETYNIKVDPLPECPDLIYADDLKIAIEKILGRKLNIKRNPKWRRIWAAHRGTDRDAAAKRLGL